MVDLDAQAAEKARLEAEQKAKEEAERKAREEAEAEEKAKKAAASDDKSNKAPRFPVDSKDLDKLETVAKLGGSTGAKKVRASDGGEYVFKRGGAAGGDAAAHLRNECVADAFYRALKIDVPDFRIYETDEGPVKLSRFMDGGRSLGDWWNDASPSERAAMKKKLRRGLAADVMLGNWDVVGMSADNIMVFVDENGEPRPWRIDNGGALGFRAQGARKRPDQWSDRAFVDELWTMTGKGAFINQNVPSNIPQYYGNVDALDLADEIAATDWGEAMNALPPDDRKAFEKRLREVRELADRRRRFFDSGYTQEYADDVVTHTYLMSKDGLREALRFKIADPNRPNALYGWFRSYRGEPAKTLNNPRGGGPNDYTSFTHYLSDYMDKDELDWITNAHKDQGGDSYNKESCKNKILRLIGQGFDPRNDVRFPDLQSWRKAVEDAGYYIGVFGGTHARNIEAAYQWAANLQSPQEFYAALHGERKYAAAVQLALENADFIGNDAATKTLILGRTENPVILDPAIQPGDVATHKPGVNESHGQWKAITVFGSASTMVRVPYPRVSGLYFAERYVGSPSQGQYLTDGENEITADTHGLDIIYLGNARDPKFDARHETHFADFEKFEQKAKGQTP